MANVVVSSTEAERRTIRRDALVSCNQAFIDCRTPGSDKKENYSLIGNGVSQNPGQVINLKEDHGYNIGAAAMPNGVTNNLHMHFTAEVFLNFRGDWLFRWGKDGKGGEYISHEGDIVSMPTWIFRGFTNVGPDNGWLFTALGQADTGGHHLGTFSLERGRSPRTSLDGRQRIDRHDRRRRTPRSRTVDPTDARGRRRRPTHLHAGTGSCADQHERRPDFTPSTPSSARLSLVVAPNSPRSSATE